MVQTEKSSVAQVYEQIVSDLKLAIGNLPVSNANGRAHYYAAKALLGKVYLQMAGEPLEDSEAAALAEVELNEVIQSGRFELVKDYFSLFDASNEYSSEYLFDVEFANNGTTTYGGQVGTIDGVQTPNNLYWSAVWSTQEFYETYDPADLRRDNIARFKYVYDDNQNLVKEDLSSEPIYYAYKFRHALTEEGRGPGWANWANPINFPIIRYADVLLMYAEAVWRAHEVPSPEALEYVNQVRRRGFGVDIKTPNEAVDLKMMDGDKFAEALLAERHKLEEPGSDSGIPEYLAYSACLLAEKARAKALVIHSLSGASAREVSSCRPPQEIYGLTPNNNAVKYLNYSWGVTPILIRNPEDEPSHLRRAENFITESSYFKKGDGAVITAGQIHGSADTPRGTNLVKIFWR